jgi:DME family drug/metabolite transporter
MILAASVLFGSYGIWSKLMGDQFGIFYQGWVRAAIVLLMLMPLMMYKRQFRKLEKKDMKWMWLFIGFTLFTQAPLYYAFITTSVGTATLLFYAAFIITSFLVGKFIIGEKITVIKLTAMLLAFVGLTFVFGFSLSKFSLLGMAMAALNGIASGGEVSSSKKLSSKYPSLLLVFYSWVAILVTHLVISIGVGEVQWLPENSVQWWAMLAYSVAGLVSFWLVVEGFKYVDASIGSLVGLLEIIWAVIFGAIFFNEHIGLTIIAGGILILLAGFLPDAKNIIEHKKTKQPAEPLREV